MLIPVFEHRTALFGVQGREIVEFGGVVLEIEELPVAFSTGGGEEVEDFEFALADEAVAEQFAADPVGFCAGALRGVGEEGFTVFGAFLDAIDGEIG